MSEAAIILAMAKRMRLVDACTEWKGQEWLQALPMLQEDPSATSQNDNNGKLPLHFAAENHASVEVVEALVRADPSAAAQPDNCGKLPLHIAAENHASVEVIEALLRADHSAAAKKDLKENLPLHLALVNK